LNLIAGKTIFVPSADMFVNISRDEVQQEVNRILVFIREAKAELKKVTWPGKQQIWQSTLIVIAFTLLVSVYLGILDIGLTAIFSRVFS
jgi:preprotein translocase subunit SecE